MLQYYLFLGKRRYTKSNTPQWRINHQIRSPEVRVLDEGGKQVGVMKVSEALKKAQEAKLDLVEIAAKARPPVVKIIDFGKFKYREEKKLKKQKKKTKVTEVKEIRFSPFMGEADYQTRMKRVNEFLHDGHKIRPVVKFKGRQMGSKKFGYEILERLVSDVTHPIVIDMEPKFLGRHLAMVISPTNKKDVNDAEEAIKKVKNKKLNTNAKTPLRSTK